MHKIRVLHIFSGVGGGISAWIRLAAETTSESIVNDAMAFAITNKNEFQDIIIEHGGVCIEMPRVKSGIFHLMMFVKDVILSGDYDVVHCHMDGVDSLLFAIVSRWMCRKPFIIHAHRTDVERFSLKNYRKIIFIVNRLMSNFLCKYKIACGLKAKDFVFGKKIKTVNIIYNSVDGFCKDREIFPVGDAINLITIGRLNKVKNHDFSLQVVKKLCDSGIAVNLKILGDGELREHIKLKIKEMNLDDKVSMLGYCNNIADYLLAADVMLLPSFSEGLPTVMLESQKYGCAVIASSRVTKECDLGIGLVCFCGIDEDWSIDEWTEKVINFGKKKSLRQAAIIEKIEQKGFDSKSVYENYLELLRRITGEEKRCLKGN